MIVQLSLSLQLAYQAWVTSVKAALRDRQRRQRELRRLERGDKSKERDNRSNQEAGLESGTFADTHQDLIVKELY